MPSYLIDISVLVDALNKTITVRCSLGAVDDHLDDALLLIRRTSRVTNECRTTIRLHEARVIRLRRVGVGRSAHIHTTRRL